MQKKTLRNKICNNFSDLFKLKILNKEIKFLTFRFGIFQKLRNY